MNKNLVNITDVSGNKFKEKRGNEARCDNCGKKISKAVNTIVGGQLVEGEWACCSECYDEMIEKGCCFEELGDGVYRQQKY